MCESPYRGGYSLASAARGGAFPCGSFFLFPSMAMRSLNAPLLHVHTRDECDGQARGTHPSLPRRGGSRAQCRQGWRSWGPAHLAQTGLNGQDTDHADTLHLNVTLPTVRLNARSVLSSPDYMNHGKEAAAMDAEAPAISPVTTHTGQTHTHGIHECMAPNVSTQMQEAKSDGKATGNATAYIKPKATPHHNGSMPAPSTPAPPQKHCIAQGTCTIPCTTFPLHRTTTRQMHMGTEAHTHTAQRLTRPPQRAPVTRTVLQLPAQSTTVGGRKKGRKMAKTKLDEEMDEYSQTVQEVYSLDKGPAARRAKPDGWPSPHTAMLKIRGPLMEKATYTADVEAHMKSLFQAAGLNFIATRDPLDFEGAKQVRQFLVNFTSAAADALPPLGGGDQATHTTMGAIFGKSSRMARQRSAEGVTKITTKTSDGNTHDLLVQMVMPAGRDKGADPDDLPLIM